MKVGKARHVFLPAAVCGCEQVPGLAAEEFRQRIDRPEERFGGESSSCLPLLAFAAVKAYERGSFSFPSLKRFIISFVREKSVV